jgi:hypothetical protein
MGVKVLQQSSTGNEVITTDEATNYIFEGRAFSIKIVEDNIPEGNNYYLFTTGTYTIIKPISCSVADGPFKLEYRINHNYTGGTPISATNRNLLSTNTPKGTATSGPTGTDTGDVFSEILVGSSSSGGFFGGSTGGGSASDDDLLILPKGASVLVNVVNNSGGTTYCGLSVTWYE